MNSKKYNISRRSDARHPTRHEADPGLEPSSGPRPGADNGLWESFVEMLKALGEYFVHILEVSWDRLSSLARRDDRSLPSPARFPSGPEAPPVWPILTQVAESERLMDSLPARFISRSSTGLRDLRGQPEDLLPAFAEAAAAQGASEFLEGWKSQVANLRSHLEAGEEERLAALLARMREWVAEDLEDAREHIEQVIGDLEPGEEAAQPDPASRDPELGPDPEAEAVRRYLVEKWELLTGRPDPPALTDRPSELLVHFARLLRASGRLQAAKRVQDRLNQEGDIETRAKALVEALEHLARARESLPR